MKSWMVCRPIKTTWGTERPGRDSISIKGRPKHELARARRWQELLEAGWTEVRSTFVPVGSKSSSLTRHKDGPPSSSSARKSSKRRILPWESLVRLMLARWLVGGLFRA